MFVKPGPGRKVRDPITKRHLPERGKEVPESTFWIRRLSVGDVVRVDVPISDSSGPVGAPANEE